MKYAALAIVGVLLSTMARGDGLSGSVSPQLGGSLSGPFDGGISASKAVSTPVTTCAQTGLIFTSSCNAILYVVLF